MGTDNPIQSEHIERSVAFVQHRPFTVKQLSILVGYQIEVDPTERFARIALRETIRRWLNSKEDEDGRIYIVSGPPDYIWRTRENANELELRAFQNYRNDDLDDLESSIARTEKYINKRFGNNHLRKVA